MCLAIYIPPGRYVPIKRLKKAHKANPDGWGFAWISGGRLHARKSTWFDGFLNDYRMRMNDIRLIHFRTASSGKIDIWACHPFFVNPSLAFVENGNLPEFADGTDGLTDIQRFNKQVLRRLPDGFLHTPEIRQALEKYCAESCVKMIFMDSAGRVDIVNESAGEWVNGCWFSNGGIENYVGYGYSGAYYYRPDEIRHKGGLLSVQMFPEDRRQNWAQCSACKGWHPVARVTEGVCGGCGTLQQLKGFCR